MKRKHLSGPIYSVDKALSILEEIGRHKNGLRLTDIARTFDLEKSTVHRLLATMEKHNFVKQSNDLKYALGLKIFQLGIVKQASMPFRRMAIPYLENLRSITGETALLGAIVGNELFYLDKEESAFAVRGSIDLGVRKPLFCDAVGKALVAFQNEKYLLDYFKELRPKAFTPNTKTKISDIKKDLDITRQNGYAVDHEESELGLYGLALPIRNIEGEVIAAIGIAYPIIRFTLKREQQLCKTLKNIGRRFNKETCFLLKA